jgi:hypothetical protein
VDSSTPTISSKTGHLLLEGPIISHLQNNNLPSPKKMTENNYQRISANNKNIMVLGI